MVKFIEDNHKYLNSENSVLTSATQLIHLYSPKKDWDKIAERYAKKNNLTKEEVKAAWRRENEISVDRGTAFHRQREQELSECRTIEEDGKCLTIFPPMFDDDGNKISTSQKLDDGIYPELLLFLNSAKICGQADYVVISDGVINIMDYKTNKAIKMNGYVDWEGNEERMLDPISDIPNSNYWHYALQLNIYAYIIKKNNPKFKLGKLQLLHVKFDEFGEPNDKVPYDLPDLQYQVNKLITHFKSNNNGALV